MTRSGFHYFRVSRITDPFYVELLHKKGIIFGGGFSASKFNYVNIVTLDDYRVLEYAKNNKPELIVDIGANAGTFSKMCSILFPEAKICAYEPNPKVLPTLLKNAEGTNIKVFPYAVLNKKGIAMLDVSSGSIDLAKISTYGNISVESIVPSEIAPACIIDLLKMDCEGSEWEILPIPDLFKRTKNLCMEYHGRGGAAKAKELLLAYGHEILDISGTDDCGLLWSRNKKLRG